MATCERACQVLFLMSFHLTVVIFSILGTLQLEGGDKMASKNRILVPGARQALDRLKADVMQAQGYDVDKSEPNNVKYRNCG